MISDCKACITPQLPRRRGNVVTVEVGQPSARCINKRPAHWPEAMSAVRWLASGGESYIFGLCCSPCPLDEKERNAPPEDENWGAI